MTAIASSPAAVGADAEVVHDVARQSGCTFQRLGPRRLRAETAAISALSIIAARFGDI